MIKLTYVHWNSGEFSTMLLNPSAVIAVTASERKQQPCSNVKVDGYNFSVRETVDEIYALINEASK